MMLRMARWLIFLVALVALLVWTSRRRLHTMRKDEPSGSLSHDGIDDALKDFDLRLVWRRKPSCQRQGSTPSRLRAVGRRRRAANRWRGTGAGSQRRLREERENAPSLPQNPGCLL